VLVIEPYVQILQAKTFLCNSAQTLNSAHYGTIRTKSSCAALQHIPVTVYIQLAVQIYAPDPSLEAQIVEIQQGITLLCYITVRKGGLFKGKMND
jgi:hypothetical protein